MSDLKKIIIFLLLLVTLVAVVSYCGEKIDGVEPIHNILGSHSAQNIKRNP